MQQDAYKIGFYFHIVTNKPFTTENLPHCAFIRQQWLLNLPLIDHNASLFKMATLMVKRSFIIISNQTRTVVTIISKDLKVDVYGKPQIFQSNFHTFSTAKLLIHASISMQKYITSCPKFEHLTVEVKIRFEVCRLPQRFAVNVSLKVPIHSLHDVQKKTNN